MIRKHCLWIGLACITIALLFIAALATASEITVSAVAVSEGAGYDQPEDRENDLTGTVGIGWRF